MTPLETIEEIKTFYPFELQCYAFARIMQMVYEGSIIYYNFDHCLIEIDGKFYDWNGLQKKSKNYNPLFECTTKEQRNKLKEGIPSFNTLKFIKQ